MAMVRVILDRTVGVRVVVASPGEGGAERWVAMAEEDGSTAFPRVCLYLVDGLRAAAAGGSTGSGQGPPSAAHEPARHTDFDAPGEGVITH